MDLGVQHKVDVGIDQSKVGQFREFTFGKFHGIRLLQGLNQPRLPWLWNRGARHHGGNVSGGPLGGGQVKASFQIVAEGQGRLGLRFLGAPMHPSLFLFQLVEGAQGDHVRRLQCFCLQRLFLR